MSKLKISGIPSLDEEFKYLDIEKALNEEVELSGREARYVEKVVMHDQYLQDVAEVMGMIYEEYEQSDHPDFDLLDGIARELKDIYKVPSHIMIGEKDALKVYKMMVDGQKMNEAELESQSSKYRYFAVEIKGIYQIDFYSDKKVLGQIERYFRGLKRKDEQMRDQYGI